MNPSTSAPTSLDAALSSVSEWKTEQQTRGQAEIDRLDTELEGLRTAMRNLQEQLEAVARVRAKQLSELETLDRRAVERSHQGVFAALQHQHKVMQERAAAVLELERAHRAQVDASLSSPEAAGVIQEYEAFARDVAPTLAALPQSYRDAILGHHKQVEQKVLDLLATLEGSPPSLEADAVDVEVVFSVDPPQGPAELLLLVLPVDELVYTAWLERPEDLQTRLALRCVQAVYEVCGSLGMTAVEAFFGGHQGLLAIEVDVSVAQCADLIERVTGALQKVFDAAEELNASRLSVRPHFVEPDLVLGPEESADEPESPMADAPTEEVRYVE